MNIVLLAPTPPDISAFGLRSISAWMQRAGHEVRCVFLPGGIERLRHGGEYVYRYSAGILDQVVELCRKADLVGVSFMSLYLDRAVALTRVVRQRLEVPVVWGGTHPTIQPWESLAEADYVCVEEGEGAILDLLGALESHRDVRDVPNLIQRGMRPGPIPVRPLIEDLDALPPPDFLGGEHYLHDPRTDRIIPLGIHELQQALPLMPDFGGRTRKVYRTMTSRGCPHRCAYCVNARKAALNPDETYMRRRSPQHVIHELETILSRLPSMRGVHFFDDVFTSAPREWLAELADAYRRRIGLPFYCQVSPTTIDADRMDLLLDAGMIFIEMGIQSGSQREKDLYRRPESNEEVRQAAELFDRFRDRLLTPRYHVILDNPWGTVEDDRATLELLTTLPRPFQLCLASLTLYPGTELAEKARSEGLLTDEVHQVYRKPFYRPRPRYLNLLISLTDVSCIPRKWLQGLAGPRWTNVLDRPMWRPLHLALFWLSDQGRLLAKGLDALRRGQLWRIRRYLGRVR